MSARQEAYFGSNGVWALLVGIVNFHLKESIYLNLPPRPSESVASPLLSSFTLPNAFLEHSFYFYFHFHSLSSCSIFLGHGLSLFIHLHQSRYIYLLRWPVHWYQIFGQVGPQQPTSQGFLEISIWNEMWGSGEVCGHRTGEGETTWHLWNVCVSSFVPCSRPWASCADGDFDGANTLGATCGDGDGTTLPEGWARASDALSGPQE